MKFTTDIPARETCDYHPSFGWRACQPVLRGGAIRTIYFMPFVVVECGKSANELAFELTGR